MNISTWTADDWVKMITTVVAAVTALATIYQQFRGNDHAVRITKLEDK